MLPFSRPSCYFKTRLPSCALGTSFYTVSEGCDLMTYINNNYTSYSAPSPLTSVGCMWNNGSHVIRNHRMQAVSTAYLAPMPAYTVILVPPLIMIVTNH